jgi:hypothetical protein
MLLTLTREDFYACTQDDDWTFGKNILYDMCNKNPSHNENGVIIGKLWIIGRTYAAALERRKNVTETPAGDNFYTNKVAPKMFASRNELDEKINKLYLHNQVNEENIPEILNTHQFLTTIFESLTKLKKRSLASKYLHFHIPQLFFIYDSRAIETARKIAKSLPNKSNIILSNCNYDSEYFELVKICFELQKYAYDEYQLRLSPLNIDNLLTKIYEKFMTNPSKQLY